ncbi:CapA family protein [Pseudoclavibacter sp. 13-3]|uniref:CapA family protein n=1 Tax=Pseudoclavibacter sp. 13-3 TaxID=2901228 RepID=UPI001E4FC3B8|nr:CapA family protein [Pseudoclavibacter sp. 13-3]MCD7101826.1 CapA family protein [Pseudoclavibacter sp. 13-3]
MRRQSPSLPLSLCAGLIGLTIAVTGCSSHTAPDAPGSAALEQTTSAPSTTTEQRVTVSAMGDMLPHHAVNAEAKTTDGYDYGRFFDAIRPIYQSSDLVFCNEEVLASATSPAQITTYPQFRAPTQFAESLSRDVGCNDINLANNHMADYEQSDIDRTRDTWDALQPKLIAGANRSPEEQRRVSYADVNGLKIAQLAFTAQSNQEHTAFGLNTTDGPLMDEQLAEARKQADVVMVSMHWGTEDSTATDAPQRELTQKLVAAGVDVVIGTGPHVLQPAEFVDRPDGGRTLVWHSLGNMLSTQVPVDNRTGGIARWQLVRTGDGPVTVEQATFTPTFMDFVARGVPIAARHDLRILPMSQADERVRSEFPGETADSRYAFVQKTLGDQVQVVR